MEQRINSSTGKRDAETDNGKMMMLACLKLSSAFAPASRSSRASATRMWWSRSSHTATTAAKSPNSLRGKILASSADSEHAALRSNRSQTNSVCLTSAFLNGSLDLQNLEYALPSLKSGGRRCPPPSVTVPVATTLIVPQRAEITEPAGGERAVTIEEPAPPAASTPMRCTNRLIRIRKRKMKVHHRKKRMRKHMASFRRMWLKRAANAEVAFRVEMMGKVKIAQKFDPKKYVDESLGELHRELVPKTIDGKRRPQWLIKQIGEERDVMRERERRLKTDLITQEPLVRDGESVEDFVKRMEAARRK